VANPPIAADLRQALDRLRAVAAKIALDLELGVDERAEPGDFLVGQVTNLLVRIELELLADLACARGTDAVDVREPDLEPLLGGEIDACNASRSRYPCLCLCRGLEQITMVRPCRLITRQRSHIGLTDGRTFIVILCSRFSGGET